MNHLRKYSKHLISAAVPIILTALFYILRVNTRAMDFAARYISSPVRAVLGHIFGVIGSVSATEIIAALLAVFVIYYIFKTIVLVARRRERLKILGRRFFSLGLAALYICSAFLWVWDTNYYSSPFYTDSGVLNSGVLLSDLTAATAYFADGANKMSGSVLRDADGHFIETLDDIFANSTNVYDNIESEFPGLRGGYTRPKRMLFSVPLSYLGFTGIYFALTGEANINTDAPRALIPATVAHETAHSRGVGAEENANFAGIAASVTSGIPMYDYSGYLMGLIYLSNALYDADHEAYATVASTYNNDVRRDLTDNFEYWAMMQTDNPAAEAVNEIYDGFLKSNGQEQGIKSYGACVDLLVSWVKLHNS